MTAIKRPELLPCPFCGGEAYLNSETGNNVLEWATCRTCGVSTDAVDNAPKAWNTRLNANGWIPCAERLPDAASKQALCIVTVEFEDGDRRTALSGYFNDSGWACEVNLRDGTQRGKVIAWMLRPEPFTPSEER